MNWLTMLPLVQFTAVPVTLTSTVLALPGLSSICCTSELAKSASAATEKIATPQSFTELTVNWAGPGWPDGRVTLLFAATPARAAEPSCSAAVRAALLSEESATTEPPPLKLMMRPLVDPLMCKLPACTLRGLPGTMLPTTATVVSKAGTPLSWVAKVAEFVPVKSPPMKVRPSTSELVDRSPSVIRSYCCNAPVSASMAAAQPPLGVGVTVGETVFVAVGVALGDCVGVAVGVLVGVLVGVMVGVTVGVLDGVFVGVRLGVAVGVRVGVAVGEPDGVAVGVRVGVRVGVDVGVGVRH